MKCGGSSPTQPCVYQIDLCNGKDDCGNGWDEDKELCGQIDYYLFIFVVPHLEMRACIWSKSRHVTFSIHIPGGP